MTRMKIAALGAALAAAGATGAETANAWKFITVRKQQVAVFTPNQWSCRNFARESTARPAMHTPT